MNEQIQILECPKCGAPVISEVCPYCHNATGYSVSEIDQDINIIECKEVHFDKQRFKTFGLFGGVFLFFGLLLIISQVNGPSAGTPLEGLFLVTTIFMSLFLFIPAACFLMPIILRGIRYLILKCFGKKIRGTVIGYCNDNFTVNGHTLQVVKILFEFKSGKYVMLYQLGTATQPYKVNSQIDVIYYKGIAMITKEMPDFI